MFWTLWCIGSDVDCWGDLDNQMPLSKANLSNAETGSLIRSI